LIAVVGGGITGLAIGLELARRDEDFLIFEASDRPGGVIRSREVEGRILDWGPQRARLTRGLDRVIRDVGIEQEVVEAEPGLDLFIFTRGRLRKVPFGPLDFALSDIVSPLGKLRLLLEPFTGAADPEERVSSFFSRKVGPELYETVIAPLYGGLYGSDPADMQVGLSLIHVLRTFGVGRSLLLPLLRRGGRIDPPPACTFRNGMATLPRAMASHLGERVRLASPVSSLTRTREGWRLEGDDLDMVADQVVLTTPAPATAALLEREMPSAAGALRKLRYNPLAVVHLEAETDLRGLGFQVAFTEDLLLRGVTFNDSLFGRRDLYTAYLGGALHPEVAEMSSEELGSAALRDFRLTTGFDARVLAVECERMPAWDLSWHALREVAPPEGVTLAGNWHSRPGIPGRLAEAGRVAGGLAGAPWSG